MIKLQERPQGLRLKSITFPDNLTPIVFRCKDCGSTIKRIEATESFYLMHVSAEVEKKKKKICSYCKRLLDLKGIE